MKRNTTLDEVQARPMRSGAPARCRSHYEAILELLRQREARGVLGSELYSRPDLYGRSPRNRISELRKDGHLIEGRPRGRPHGASDWLYRLIRDNQGSQTCESEYMKRVRAENAAVSPLCFGESNR